MAFISLNGTFYPENTPVITGGNISFKYGEGVFETMAVLDGKIQLQQLHLDRAQLGLSLLRIAVLPDELQNLPQEILQLCLQNDCRQRARVRVAFFRNEEDGLGYLIEAGALPRGFEDWNEKGWKIQLFTDAQKSIDKFSNAKTANYLPYLAASRFAEENNFDEVVLLNSRGNICDGSKTNIFLVKDESIYTPSLSEGCIAGVLRRYLIESLFKKGFTVNEQPLSVEDLNNADEIFCTNTLRRIKWVEKFQGKNYQSHFSKKIAQLIFEKEM